MRNIAPYKKCRVCARWSFLITRDGVQYYKCDFCGRLETTEDWLDGVFAWFKNLFT